jgi:endonuclease G
VLAAATSRATDSSVNNCGDGGVYVRVDRYRTWINSIQGVSLP